MPRHTLVRILGALALAMLLASCASTRTLTEQPPIAYAAKDDGGLFARHAPVFVPQHHYKTYNKIGRPSARYDAQGREQIYVDPAMPVMYAQQQTFQTSKGNYTNLIYRVHFQGVPYFHLTAGKNSGLFVVITLNQKEEPVLVTTVHSCGCYLAIIPTRYLPDDAYPQEWDFAQPQSIYGEKLPARLDYPAVPGADQRPVVFLKDATHRVMDVKIGVQGDTYNIIPIPIEPMVSLKKLPLDSRTATSFYETHGFRKGYVKGAVKPLEVLLMSWWALDPHIGSDKELGDSRETGTVFYTSLKPWNRTASDMWEFARFLEFWGWRL